MSADIRVSALNGGQSAPDRSADGDPRALPGLGERPATPVEPGARV
jgi:hypothetical protein